MPQIFLKRINKEILDFNDKKYLINNSSKHIIEFLNNICVALFNEDDKYYLNVNYNNFHLMTIKIPTTYPFSPLKIHDITKSVNNHTFIIKNYSIYLNNLMKILTAKNIDYSILDFFYRAMYMKNSVLLNNLNKESCLCCRSVMCGYKWSPGLTFTNILLEYNEVMFIEKYIEINNYKKLVKIYDELIKKNMFTELPKELIELISGFFYDL
jgi:hypothetical protein